ncbi:MAG: 30S ribosomal protein S15 [Phycisphaerales bacterium]|nr:30S ribosomal protein S15 [Phycisphaerales bacterium]
MTISAATKKKTVSAHQRHEKDSGSPEVQISILTERINALQPHFKINPKDHGGRRGLILMVSQRNRLLRFLSETHRDSYSALIRKLGLRK